MKEKCSLDKLPLGVTGIVYRVNCNENIKNRIFDFGITDAIKRGDKTFRVILSEY